MKCLASNILVLLLLSTGCDYGLVLNNHHAIIRDASDGDFVIAENGRLVIGYVSRKNGKKALGYAEYDPENQFVATALRVELFAPEIQVDGTPKIGLLEQRPYIVYVDGASGWLRFIYREDNLVETWQFENIETEGEVVGVALDSRGDEPCVAYEVAPEETDEATVQLACRHNGAWSKEAVGDGHGLGSDGLAIDSGGNPHLCFLRGEDAWYFARVNDQWSSRSIEVNVDQCAIKVDLFDTVHHAFLEQTPGSPGITYRNEEMGYSRTVDNYGEDERKFYLDNGVVNSFHLAVPADGIPRVLFKAMSEDYSDYDPYDHSYSDTYLSKIYGVAFLGLLYDRSGETFEDYDFSVYYLEDSHSDLLSPTKGIEGPGGFWVTFDEQSSESTSEASRQFKVHIMRTIMSEVYP